jgi:16S rRNA (guanine(966)-N(2))-methyltransferase RsmD
MKIVVGKFRGVTIDAPRGLLSRPPLAVIRESIFNIIGPRIESKTVLDLFAGSGSLGIEAVSRGAARSHFVDSSPRCVKMISKNLAKLGISDVCAVTRQDAIEFIRRWQGPPFDIVFVDPPFLSGKSAESLSVIRPSHVGSDTTLVIARLHWREQFPIPETYSLVKKRKFGESVILFLRPASAGGIR